MSLTKPLPRIGIDRAYFAPLLTEPAAANPTYSTPFRLIGAVELAYNPNSEISSFYADNGAYVQTSRPGAIELAAVLAELMPEVYALLIGAYYNSANGQIIETQNDTPLLGAFGYRAELSDGSHEWDWFLAGVCSRPQKQYNTKGESITYNTTPLQYMARPVAYAGGRPQTFRNLFFNGDPNFPVGLTESALLNESTGWASDPNYVPVAPGVPIADFAIVSGAAGALAATWTAAVAATLVKIEILDPVTSEYNEATTSAPIAVGDNSATITGLTTGNTYTARLVVTSGTNNGVSNTDSAAAG